MESDKPTGKGRSPGVERRKMPRREYEVAYYTKELGRPMQRKMLERQLAALSEPAPLTHQADFTPQDDGSPPRADRAG